MKLSDVPWAELKIGDKVIGALGMPGTIIDLIPVENDQRQENNVITIYWENGAHSNVWHYWLDKVTYIGQ
jgi:hypothetical protein